MPVKQPKYPDILTDKSWQKKKGAISKIAGKTGVGKALDECKAAYDQVDWKSLDVAMVAPQGKACTSKVVEELWKAAVAEYNKSIDGSLNVKLKKARDLADKTSKDFSKKKLVPKKSAEHAAAVAKEADRFSVELNKNTLLQKMAAEYQRFLKSVQNNEKMIADNAKRLKLYCVQVAKGLGSISTAAEFNGKFWNESIRGVGTTLPPLSAQLGIIAEHKKWRVFASEDWKPKSDEEVAAKIKEMKPVLAGIARAAQSV